MEGEIWTAPELLMRHAAIAIRLVSVRSFSNARSYLLSGMLQCGACEERLIARPTGKKVRRYICARRPAFRSCGKLARMAEPVEEFVFEAVCIALDQVSLRQHLGSSEPETSGLVDSIREDEQSLIDLAEDYANKLFTRGKYLTARDVVASRLQGNRSLLSKKTGKVMLEGIDAGQTLREVWPTTTLDWKRALLASIIDYIVIEPALKGRNTFDPRLVRIVWRY